MAKSIPGLASIGNGKLYIDGKPVGTITDISWEGNVMKVGVYCGSEGFVSSPTALIPLERTFRRPLTQAAVDAAVSKAKKIGATVDLWVDMGVAYSHLPCQWRLEIKHPANNLRVPLDSSTWPEGTQSPYEFEQAVKFVAEAEGWKYSLSYSAWPTDGVLVKFTDPDGREHIKTCHSNDGVKEIALRAREVGERVTRIVRKVFGESVRKVFKDCSLVRVELDEGFILFRDDVSDQEILERAEMLKERGFHAKPSPIDSQPPAVVSSVKEETMPTNEKPIASKPTLTEIAKDDATEAAYRTAAKRLTKYARATIIRAFASRGSTADDRASRTRAMEEFLSGEMGDSIVAGALSAMISLSPDALKSRVPWIDMDRLARELRLKVEVSALDALVDVAEVYAATGVEMLTEAFRGSKIAGAIEAPKRDVMDTIRDGQVLARETQPVT